MGRVSGMIGNTGDRRARTLAARRDLFNALRDAGIHDVRIDTIMSDRRHSTVTLELTVDQVRQLVASIRARD